MSRAGSVSRAGLVCRDDLEPGVVNYFNSLLNANHFRLQYSLSCTKKLLLSLISSSKILTASHPYLNCVITFSTHSPHISPREIYVFHSSLTASNKCSHSSY